MADPEHLVTETSTPQPIIATCDRCSERMTHLRHKCRQCPDFDYCSLCVLQAAQIHPHHEFDVLDAEGVLPEEIQQEWLLKRDPCIKSNAILRLTGQSSDLPASMCRSCVDLTRMLPIISVLMQLPEVKKAIEEGEVSASAIKTSWSVRISSLVEATQNGCAFCSFVLGKFFSVGPMYHIPSSPVRPWCMEPDQQEERDNLVEYVMGLLEDLKTDTFVFTVTTSITKQGHRLPNFDKLLIEFQEADLDADVLKRILNPSGGTIRVAFDVFADSANPASKHVQSLPPNANPSSESALSTVSNWMRDCEQNHKECRGLAAPEVSGWPRRLIDLSSGGDTLKLHILESHKDYRYATLSYCWGGPQSFSLTKETHSSWITGFSVLHIPQTLQDAVRLSRSLGLSYLWVDALCIIQDDEVDKIDQIHIMAEIYRRSAVTICAKKAWSVEDGFLIDRSDVDTKQNKDLIPMGYQMPNRKATNQVDALDLPAESFGTLWLLEEQPSNFFVGREATSTRGWCLQEKFLSPRLVEFGRWPTWRCNAATLSDGGWYYDSDKTSSEARHFSRDLLKPRSELPNPALDLLALQLMLKRWHALVTDFTRRKLTFERDKLPAIAALAAEIERRTGLEYCAGLWRNDLLTEMMWSSHTREWLTRHETPLAPTWSWASVKCAVTYTDITDDALPLARVIDYKLTQHDASPPTGHIALSGPVREVPLPDFLKLLADQNMTPHYPVSNHMLDWNNTLIGHISSLPADKVSDETLQANLPNRVFAVATFTRDWILVKEKRTESTCWSGLLLRERLGGQSGGYERIGCFMNGTTKWMDPSGEEWRTETISIY